MQGQNQTCMGNVATVEPSLEDVPGYEVTVELISLIRTAWNQTDYLFYLLHTEMAVQINKGSY